MQKFTTINQEQLEFISKEFPKLKTRKVPSPRKGEGEILQVLASQEEFETFFNKFLGF